MKAVLFLLFFRISLNVSDAAPLTNNCELDKIGNVLDCSDLTEIPVGPYAEIEMINFSRNNFTKLNPFVFFNHHFHNLKKVILRHDNIQYIHPDAFGMMSSITQVDLYGNNLKNLHKNSFSGLTSLKHLHLGHNEIVLLEKEVLNPLLSLETLDLSHNKINDLEKDFLKIKPVSKLELSHNPLHILEGAILESFSLTALGLQYCNLTKLSQNAFSELPSLEYLDLSRNKLKAISDAMLKPLKKLKQLDISNNHLVYINMDVFKLPTSLKLILCSGNPLDILEGSTCGQLLRNLENRKTSNQTKLVLLESSLDDKLKLLNLNESVPNSSDFSGEFKRSVLKNSTNGIDVVLKDSTPKNGDAIEAILKMLICGVAGGCVVLLLILFGQIFYLLRRHCKQKGSLLENI